MAGVVVGVVTGIVGAVTGIASAISQGEQGKKALQMHWDGRTIWIC
jgi:hypothetical protein